MPDTDVTVVVTGISDAETLKELLPRLVDTFGADAEVLIAHGVYPSDKAAEGTLALSSLAGALTDGTYPANAGAFGKDTYLSFAPKPLTEKKRYNFQDFVSVLGILRGPGGCEWDRAQTHASIRTNLIEEAYELAEAIDLNDGGMMCEECGDVLLQSAFHTAMAADEGLFGFSDMLTAICVKLISRHTHIFGDNRANNADEALSFWEKAKQKEKKHKNYSDKLNSVAKTLPKLLYAYKIQKAAKKSGFDFADVNGCYDKLYEEIDELKEARGKEIKKEAGDMLFAAVNVLRMLKIEPEEAMERAAEKFINRFKAMEAELTASGGKLDDFTVDEMEAAWKRTKRIYP
jgi:tetrapyrrole methylase family protein/MazG family protein